MATPNPISDFIQQLLITVSEEHCLKLEGFLQKILPDEKKLLEHDDESLATLVFEHLMKIDVPVADSFRTSLTVQKNFKEYKKPSKISRETDTAVVKCMCSSYTKLKKETTAVLQPILEKLVGYNQDRLGCMDYNILTKHIHSKLTAPQLKKVLDQINIAMGCFVSLQQFPLEFSKFQAYCPLSCDQKKRVFYLMDMLFPTKMEIIVSPEDTVNPPWYPTRLLPAQLTPNFENTKLNSGTYKIIGKESAITTYFYTFNASTPASSASRESLEIGRVLPKQCKIDTILPRSNTFQLEKYKVPKKFLGKPDVIILVQTAKKEGIEEALEYVRKKYPRLDLKYCPSTSIPSTSIDIPSTSIAEIPYVDGSELSRNQRLSLWVHKELKKFFGSNFYFIPNTKNDAKISRFNKSRDDFCFFKKPQPQGCHLNATSVFEEVELDGDSKEDAIDNDKYQIMANMNKCLADIGIKAIQNGVHFKIINVLGLLVDYTSEKVVKVYHMKFDFTNRTPSIQLCDKVDYSITEAFSYTFALL